MIAARLLMASRIGDLSPVFSPSDIAGLKQWFKADSIAQTDGTAVSAWTDLSSNSNLAQATGIKQPLYKTNIVNGLAVVRFDGSNDVLVGASDLNLAQPYTIFSVTQQASGGGRIFDNISGAQGRSTYEYSAGGGAVELFAGSFLGGATNKTGAFHVFTAIGNSTSSSVYYDGVQDATGNAGSSGIGTLLVGGDDGGSPMNGDIASLLIYNSALGTIDRQSVEAYLKSLYNTP